MKSRDGWSNVVIPLSVLALVAASGCSIQLGGCNQAKYERTENRQAACEAGSTIDVATTSGSIVITGTDTNECRVTAKITARASTEEEAQELAEKVQIKLDAGDRMLKIRADQPSLLVNRSLSISYEITAPRRVNVLCQSDYGSLKATALQGTVKGKTGSGSVNVEQIEGPVDLHTSYGAIDCKNLAGPTTLLQSGSGSITAVDLKGEAKIVTSYGSATCDTFAGTTLDLKTGSGKIAISNATCRDCLAETSYGALVAHHLKGDTVKLKSGSGSLDLTAVDAPSLDISTSYGAVKAHEITTAKLLAHSGSGSLDIVCTPASPAGLTAEVKSSYGDIDFTAPPTFSGRVDLHTDYGSIHAALPVTISGDLTKTKVIGRVGEGTGLLHLQTGSGSITLK
jgi:DUF4097 and DUF4098 domain-containing protein YvlB